MAKAIYAGPMASNTRVSLRKISVTVREDSSGVMAASTKAAGTRVSSLASDTTLTSMVSRERASGRTVDVSSGSMMTRAKRIDSEVSLKLILNLNHSCLKQKKFSVSFFLLCIDRT